MLAQEAEQLVPPEETSDWTPDAAFSENAFAALAYALQVAATGDAQAAVWCARQAIEAVDLAASERLAAHSYDQATERAIAADPGVQVELRRQEADLRDAAAVGTSDHRVTAAIQARARQDALAFFG